MTNSFYKEYEGKKLFFARGFTDAICEMSNEWFLEEISLLTEEQRAKGYESLKVQIARIVNKIKNKEKDFERIDSLVLNGNSINNFIEVSKFFFGLNKIEQSDVNVWAIDMHESVEFWTKFHFLIGIYLDEIKNKNHQVVFEIYAPKPNKSNKFLS